MNPNNKFWEVLNKQINDFREEGIPKCFKCSKPFKKMNEENDFHSVWERDCECYKKKIRISLG